MTYPNSNTSRNFSCNEIYNEFRFHIRELTYDLQNISREIKQLIVYPVKLIISEDLLTRVLDIISDVDHSVNYHLSKVIQLFGSQFDNSFLIDSGARLAHTKMEIIGWPDGTSEMTEAIDLLEIRLRVDEILKCLDKSLSLISSVASISFTDESIQTHKQDLQDNLNELIKTLAHKMRLDFYSLYEITFEYFKAFNRDDEMGEEQYSYLTDTPLREINHRDARYLQICPNCEADLGGEDRTFDGSYCESCRTAWVCTSSKPEILS